MCVYAKYRLSDIAQRKDREDGGEEKQDRENKKQGEKKFEEQRLYWKRMPIKRRIAYCITFSLMEKFLMESKTKIPGTTKLKKKKP